MTRPLNRNELLGLILIAFAILFWLLCISPCLGEVPRHAVARVVVQDEDGGQSIGSGTLIDVRNVPDGLLGLVLSCAHNFRDRHPQGEILVDFPNTSQDCKANLLDANEALDLAMLEVLNPPVGPSSVCFCGDCSGDLVACGYPGRSMNQECVTGRRGPTYDGGRGQVNSTLMGCVQGGVSGGGIFNNGGHLVGVVWGCVRTDKFGRPVPPETMFTTNAQLKQYCQPYGIQGNCGGCCPRPQPQGRPVIRISPPRPQGGVKAPAAKPPAPPIKSCDCAEQLAAILVRIEALEKREPEKGDTGATGMAGKQGPKGDPGPAGKFSVDDLTPADITALAELLPPFGIERFYGSESLGVVRRKLGGIIPMGEIPEPREND